MKIASAQSIANQFISKIKPACSEVIIVGDIANNVQEIKNIEIIARTSNRKLLDALLLACSTPIQSSKNKLVRLYQNVKVTVYLLQ